MIELNYIAALLAFLIYFPIVFLWVISRKFKGTFMKVHAQNKKDHAMEIIAGITYGIIIVLFLVTNFVSSKIMLYLGFCIYSIALIITFFGYHTFFKAPQKTLIVKWPFTISRNPTYFFGLIALLCLALVTNSVIHYILIFLQFLITHYIIQNEEIFCEQKYGKEYAAYKRKVRRYI
jgi:protein-S-isoprenylcysteine O-methyltransferase Ste14